VFACGDGLQGIYLWRHADPRWFAAATTEGTYLGVDWDTHENRTATTTYRCVPDIAAGINAIAEPVFSDPARGNLGDLDASYPRLDAARATARAAMEPRSTSRRSQASVTPAPRCGRTPTGSSGRRTCSRPTSRGARRRNLLQRRRRPARRHGAVPPRDADARVRGGVRRGRPPGPHCDRRAVRLPRRRDGARRLRVADRARLSAAHEQTPHRVSPERRV